MKNFIKRITVAAASLAILGTFSAITSFAGNYPCRPSDPHPHGYHVTVDESTFYRRYRDNGSRRNYWLVTYSARRCDCCGAVYDYVETNKVCVW